VADLTLKELAEHIVSATNGDAGIEETLKMLEAIKREEDGKPPKPDPKPVPTLSGTKAKYRGCPGVSVSFDPKLLAMQPPPDYLDTFPTVRGRLRQEDLEPVVAALKGMAGVLGVNIETQLDGTAEIQVKAEAPQPVADMIMSLIPATPAKEVEILTVKSRGLGPLTNVVHDEVMFDFDGFPKPPKKVYDAHAVTNALMRKRDLAWGVLQELRHRVLIGPWRDDDKVFLVREDSHGDIAVRIGPTQDERFYVVLFEETSDESEPDERFDTLEEAMNWVDEDLEERGYLPV